VQASEGSDWLEMFWVEELRCAADVDRQLICTLRDGCVDDVLIAPLISLP